MTSAVHSFDDSSTAERAEYVTIRVAGQLLGIPVLTVEDVLGPHKILYIPLAPSAVAGALNLRGRIVTALDLRLCLGLQPCADPSSAMSVVVEHEGELYSLLVDEVGDVLAPPLDRHERNPSNLDPPWRDLCAGVYRLDDALLLVLDVKRLVGVVEEEAA